MSCPSCTNVNTVEQWYSCNCTYTALPADQTFYNSLFQNFYQNSDNQLWIPGINDPSDDQLFFSISSSRSL